VSQPAKKRVGRHLLSRETAHLFIFYVCFIIFLFKPDSKNTSLILYDQPLSALFLAKTTFFMIYYKLSSKPYALCGEKALFSTGLNRKATAAYYPNMSIRHFPSCLEDALPGKNGSQRTMARPSREGWRSTCSLF
jgi:hypothetical protein